MPIETRRFTNTRDFERWPLVASCSQIGCNFAVCCSTFSEGEEILAKHESEGPCPFGKRGATVIMPIGKSLAEMRWEMLDRAVNKAVAASSEEEKAAAKGEILGIARCIALVDSPFYGELPECMENPELVMKEAADRLKMRRGEMPFRPTPGCHIQHDVHALHERVKNRVPQQSTERASSPGVTKHPLDAKIAALDDKLVNKIIRSLGVGMEADFLADTLGVDLPVVRRIAAQPNRFARTGG